MKLKILLIALLICGVAYASTCSYDAYMNACHNCPLDARGKMNESCSGRYQQNGKKCIITSHPILAYNYWAGKCPEVDTCASELEACKKTYETGNDSVDCKNFMVESCFKESDQCVQKAVDKCGSGLDLTGLGSIGSIIADFCPFAMVLSVVLLGTVYAQSKSIVK